MKVLIYLLSFSTIGFLGCKKCDCNNDPKTPTEKTIILQPNADEGNDVYLSSLSNDATWANGNNNVDLRAKELSAAAWSYNGGLSKTRTLLSFNLTKLPQTAEIVSARLSLYGLPSSIVAPQGNSGDNRILIQQVISNWDESTVTWNTQPEVNTTNQIEMGPFTGAFNVDLLDIDVTPLAKAMQLRPDKTGGFCIRLKEETAFRSLCLASSEYTDASKRPKLIIVYKS